MEELLSGLAPWFKSNWKRNFEHKKLSEIMEKFKFDNMRQLYEVTKFMEDEEKNNFMEKIRINIEILQNEMSHIGITVYTLLNKKRIIFHNLKLDIFYFQSDIDEFTVFENNTKMFMDKKNLDLYLKIKTKLDLKKGLEKGKKTS